MSNGNLVTFEVEGLDDCLEGLEQLGNYFGNKLVGRKAIIPALKEAGEIIQRTQQDLAPVEDGVLRDSIKVSARPTNQGDKRSKYYRGETAAAFIGPRPRAANVPPERRSSMTGQMLAQEFGTAKTAPHPYIRPAMELRGEAAMNVLRLRLQEEIDKLTKRINREGRKRGKMLAKYGMMS